MDKKINSLMVAKIPAVEFNSVTIIENGEKRVLSPTKTKDYIMKFVRGGKSLGQLEKKLIEDGIKGSAWSTRKKVMKMFEDLLADKITEDDRKELYREISEEEEEEDQDL